MEGQDFATMLFNYRHAIHGITCSGRPCIALIDRVDRWEADRLAAA